MVSSGAADSRSVVNLGVALSKAIFSIRELLNLQSSIDSESFKQILGDLYIEAPTIQSLIEKINFKEGELKVDDLLARMELIRATVEEGNSYTTSREEIVNGGGVIWANEHALSKSNLETSSALDPWKRTVSLVSMDSKYEETPTPLHKVTLSDATLSGPWYDRHYVYQIKLNSQEVAVNRRFSDFDWLCQYLMKKYPFRSIPSIPEKNPSSVFVPSTEFLEKRKIGLGQFLAAVINHPILQKDPILIEFLSENPFTQIRKQLRPAWEDEFTLPENMVISSNGTHADELPESALYDDAMSWVKQLLQELDSVQNFLDLLPMGSINAKFTMENLYESMNTIISITQFNETKFEIFPKDISNFSNACSKLAEELAVISSQLSFFKLLAFGCESMIKRTERLKFDQFDQLSRQIITNQAYAEKLRIKEGPNSVSQLEKALQKVYQLQRELLYFKKRNEFADKCLKQELGWLVKMIRPLPVIFKDFFDSLHSNLKLASESVRT